MRIALITGAARGLGLSYLETISERYPDLDEFWALDMNTEPLEGIREKLNGKLRFLTADLTTQNAFDDLKTLLEAYHPQINVLINNAGAEKLGRFDERSEKELDLMLSLNVRAVTMIDRVCLPYMTRGSLLIHTASIYSFSPVPADAVYAASKIYVRYLSLALYEEMKKKGVTVTVLCPGSMKTGLDQKKERTGKVFMPYLDTKRVALEALKAAEKGRRLCIPGLSYKASYLASRLLPLPVTARHYGKNYKY